MWNLLKSDDKIRLSRLTSIFCISRLTIGMLKLYGEVCHKCYKNHKCHKETHEGGVTLQSKSKSHSLYGAYF